MELRRKEERGPISKTGVRAASGFDYGVHDLERDAAEVNPVLSCNHLVNPPFPVLEPLRS
jgi:hypothetical protein